MLAQCYHRPEEGQSGSGGSPISRGCFEATEDMSAIEVCQTNQEEYTSKEKRAMSVTSLSSRISLLRSEGGALESDQDKRPLDAHYAGGPRLCTTRERTDCNAKLHASALRTRSGVFLMRAVNATGCLRFAVALCTRQSLESVLVERSQH